MNSEKMVRDGHNAHKNSGLGSPRFRTTRPEAQAQKKNFKRLNQPFIGPGANC